MLDTSSELTAMIDKCIKQETAFYTLTFDPPLTNQVDDYHDLKVVMGKPDLTGRTRTGYYNEPVYHDHLSEARRVSVAELEQMLETHGRRTTRLRRNFRAWS